MLQSFGPGHLRVMIYVGAFINGLAIALVVFRVSQSALQYVQTRRRWKSTRKWLISDIEGFLSEH